MFKPPVSQFLGLRSLVPARASPGQTNASIILKSKSILQSLNYSKLIKSACCVGFCLHTGWIRACIRLGSSSNLIWKNLKLDSTGWHQVHLDDTLLNSSVRHLLILLNKLPLKLPLNKLNRSEGKPRQSWQSSFWLRISRDILPQQSVPRIRWQAFRSAWAQPSPCENCFDCLYSWPKKKISHWEASMLLVWLTVWLWKQTLVGRLVPLSHENSILLLQVNATVAGFWGKVDLLSRCKPSRPPAAALLSRAPGQKNNSRFSPKHSS